MTWNIKLSKKNKRVLSSFMVKERLYDFLTGKLDPEVRNQVEEIIKFDRDLQQDLNHLKKAQDYTKSLTSIQVHPDLVEELIEQSGIVSEISQKVAFERWPQSLKWGLEAFVVIAVMISLLTVLPLEKVSEFIQRQNPQVILAEIEMRKDAVNLEVAEESAQFVDEGAGGTAVTVAQDSAKPVIAVPTPIAENTPVEVKPVVPEKAVAPVVKAPVDNRPAAATEETKPVATTGVLYRGTIAVTNVEVTGPKITEKIATLGGRKAGSVELGWKKSPNSMYYHFTIPEAKYEDLVSFLATYGNAKIQKEKHPRIMPDGIIRLIISVEEAAQ